MPATEQQAQPSGMLDPQAEVQQVQEEANELLSKALGVLKSNCQSPGMQPGQADYLTVAAVMAPIVLQLSKNNSVIRQMEVSRMAASDKTESFHALLATALAHQSEQIHELAQLQAATLRSGMSGIATNSSRTLAQHQPAQPLLSPQLRQLQQETQQRMVAQKQAEQLQQRFMNLPGASRPAGCQGIHAVLGRAMNGSLGECCGCLCFLLMYFPLSFLLTCMMLTLQGTADS